MCKTRCWTRRLAALGIAGGGADNQTHGRQTFCGAGDFEYEGNNAGAGTLTATCRVVGVHY